jgi:uncharacterized membrane protein HdeD (DUF308 family)
MTTTYTSTSNPPSLFHQLWKSSVLSGVIAVALGALVLLWPGKTLLVAAFLFGAYLLVSGISQVFFAFGLHASAGSRILLFISGAASLILGIMAFRHFGSEPLLDLQAVGKAVQHPRKLGDADHLLVGQIGDRRLAGDRCKMVFAV